LRETLPYLRDYPKLIAAILLADKQIKNSRYFHCNSLETKMMNKFNRLLSSTKKQIHNHIIQKWMKHNWMQALALNRFLRKNNMPPDIYVYVLKFYGDYTQFYDYTQFHKNT
jgi:hypothetical protein